jgi:hypothetical protein
MPSKKLKKAPSVQTSARKSDAKAPKKVSRPLTSEKVSIKNAMPAVKSAKASGLTGGFVRLSETHIQKVYR